MWGCLAKVEVPIPKKVKIGPKTVHCVFIGYAHNRIAYRFLIHKSEIIDMHVNTIIESRNASFFENVFPYKSTHESNSSKRTHDTIIGSSQGLKANKMMMNLDAEKELECQNLLVQIF